MPQTLLDDFDTHVVLRPFSGPESKLLARGDLVDTKEWRNVQPLINQRFLATPVSTAGRAAMRTPNVEQMYAEMIAEIDAEAEGRELVEAKRGPGRPRKVT